MSRLGSLTLPTRVPPVGAVGSGVGAGGVGALVGAIPLLSVLPVHPTAGLVVGFSVVAGGYGAVAVAAGYLAVAIAAGADPLAAGGTAFAFVVSGTVAAAVWHGSPSPVRGGSTRLLWRVARGVGTVTAAAIAGGVARAWAFALLEIGPFFLAPRFAVATWLAAILLTPPIVAIAGVRHTPSIPVEASPAVVAIPVIWLVAGTLIDVGYRAFDVVLATDPDAFAVRGLEALLVLHDDALFGADASRLQAALGGVLLGLLVVELVRAHRPQDAPGRGGVDR